MQDIVLGSMLTEVIGVFRTRPLAVVVLAPSADEVAVREAGRAKTGHMRITPVDLDAELRERTPRQDLWVDSTDLTIADTVEHIVDHVGEALV